MINCLGFSLQDHEQKYPGTLENSKSSTRILAALLGLAMRPLKKRCMQYWLHFASKSYWSTFLICHNKYYGPLRKSSKLAFFLTVLCCYPTNHYVVINFLLDQGCVVFPVSVCYSKTCWESIKIFGKRFWVCYSICNHMEDYIPIYCRVQKCTSV